MVNLKHPSIKMIDVVASALDHLLDKMVFVGGATVPFYIDDTGAPDIRHTLDVDCVIEISKRSEYYALEEQLTKLGFTHHIESDAPICRWKYNDVIVDIMPTEPDILGFSNRWYKEGHVHTQQIKLPSGALIMILSLPYFVASKLEAYDGRGEKDFRLSSDIEDIIAVIDGNTQIMSLLNKAPKNVKNYLKNTFRGFLKNGNFLESVEAHLPYSGGKRAQQVIKLLQEFSSES